MSYDRIAPIHLCPGDSLTIDDGTVVMTQQPDERDEHGNVSRVIVVKVGDGTTIVKLMGHWQEAKFQHDLTLTPREARSLVKAYRPWWKVWS